MKISKEPNLRLSLEYLLLKAEYHFLYFVWIFELHHDKTWIKGPSFHTKYMCVLKYILNGC